MTPRLPEGKSREPGIWRAYFDGYGGARELLRSNYLRVALVMNVLSLGRWSQPGWWDEPIAIVPSMLGFALGGYAVLLAFGDEKFREAIAGDSPNGRSPFVVMNTTFVHFIVAQTLALILALLCKNAYFPLTSLGLEADSQIVSTVASVSSARYVFWFIGYLLFLYAICTSLAATMAVFRVARWYDYMVTLRRTMKPSKEPPSPQPPTPP